MFVTRSVISLSAAVVGAAALLLNLPLGTLPPLGGETLSVFRILSSALIILRLIFWLPAAKILWGIDNHETFKILVFAGIVINLFVLVGFLTLIFSILNLLLFLHLTSKSKCRHYGLEDFYFLFTLFCLVVINPIYPWSLDALIFGNEIWPRNFLPGVNFLVLGICLILLSGGLWKLSTGTWRKGMGVYTFFALPQLTRPFFKGLTKFKRSLIALNHIEIAAQILSLFLIFFPYVREGLFFYNFLFGIALVAIFSFGLLASQFLVILGTSAVLVHAADVANGFRFGFDGLVFPVGEDPFSFAVKIALAFVFVCAVIGSGIGEDPKYPLMSRVSNALMRVSRYTVGILPVYVFTDVNLHGLYVHRLVGRNNGNETPVFEVFNEKGEPGFYTFFRPLIYFCVYYKITDACLHRLSRKAATGPFDSWIKNTCAAALDTLTRGSAGKDAEVRLDVMPVPPVPDDADEATLADIYKDRTWTTIARLCRADPDDRLEMWVNEPPELAYSARSLRIDEEYPVTP